jgi:hypothetical protein
MRIIEVIPAKRWKNTITGATASIYGAVPWSSDSEKQQWTLETVGFTWRVDNRTVGIGRVPAKTEEEAIEVMERFNLTE